jgi:hypothetical protein
MQWKNIHYMPETPMQVPMEDRQAWNDAMAETQKSAQA